jgi:hypothetical protein
VARAFHVKDWPVEVAHKVLASWVRQILRDHDAFVHRLAAYALQHRHCYGKDLMEQLRYYAKVYPITGSALTAPDWRTQVPQVLEETRARLTTRGLLS